MNIKLIIDSKRKNNKKIKRKEKQFVEFIKYLTAEQLISLGFSIKLEIVFFCRSEAEHVDDENVKSVRM